MIQPMTEHQLQIVLRFAAHIESAENREKLARKDYDLAAAAADELIESYRGQPIPEIIVAMGRVVEINRAMLTTEHTQPHHAVRLVRDAIVEHTE